MATSSRTYRNTPYQRPSTPIFSSAYRPQRTFRVVGKDAGEYDHLENKYEIMPSNGPFESPDSYAFPKEV